MTCDSILKLVPLYYYGELTPDEEERVEEHTHGCPACTRELAQQRALALNARLQTGLGQVAGASTQPAQRQQLEQELRRIKAEAATLERRP